MKYAIADHSRRTGFFLALLCLVVFVSAVQARDVTFSWTANSETVDGYKLYYKTGSSSGTPYDGTGATEGVSPVNTGNVTEFTLHGLSDSKSYRFALTAVAGTVESDYSAEITLAALPNQSSPGITATFSWLPNNEPNLAGYKIHYGTTSGYYDTTIDVGNPAPVGGRIQAQLVGLDEGITYYVAATAYDTNGLESDYSIEVSWTATSQSGGGTPPVASALNISTPEDQAVTGTVTANNDTGLPISYRIQQTVAFGTLLLISDTGSFTYTPLQNFTGTDSFTFQALDSNGNSNTATVSITIIAVNDKPTAENTAITVSEDFTTSGQLQAQDPENDSLTYTIVTKPVRGSLTVKESGAFTYIPKENTTGTDQFTFRVSDGTATSNTATVTITITAVNDPPVAKNASLTVLQNSTAYGQLLAQDSENNSLTYTVVSNPARGALSFKPSGAFIYTPEVNTTGTDHFTFRVSDGNATSNTATVSITIQPAPKVTGIFSWLPNQEPDLAGYKIHYGTESNTYIFTLDVGNPTLVNGKIQAEVKDLTEGTTYYFSITAYNTSGLESFFSTEIVWVATAQRGPISSPIDTITFGDTPDSNHSGTLSETFTNLDNQINASAEKISTWSWSSPTPNKPANTIIVKTDLSSLRKNFQITEAKLYLYLTSAKGEASYSNSIFQITGKNPIIDQVTGYNAYNGEPWTAVAPGTTTNDVPLGLADIAKHPEDTITIGTDPGYQIWTITDMVQNWISNPDENFGLLISGVSTTTETGRTFASSKNTNVSFRPKLVIRFIKRPPTPSVLSARKIR